MARFVIFATPWWVNCLVLIPAIAWLILKKGKGSGGKARLAVAALFGIAFGFVEAAAVVYLRAASGMPVGQGVTPAGIVPAGLLRTEVWREAATIAMLFAIAWLAGRSARERFLTFLWTFAFWDLFYYVWLRVAIGWPATLLDNDVLFLIPVPWVAQVWFPILISVLTIVAIGIRGWSGSGVKRG